MRDGVDVDFSTVGDAERFLFISFSDSFISTIFGPSSNSGSCFTCVTVAIVCVNCKILISKERVPVVSFGFGSLSIEILEPPSAGLAFSKSVICGRGSCPGCGVIDAGLDDSISGSGDVSGTGVDDHCISGSGVGDRGGFGSGVGDRVRFGSGVGDRVSSGCGVVRGVCGVVLPEGVFDWRRAADGFSALLRRRLAGVGVGCGEALGLGVADLRRVSSSFSFNVLRRRLVGTSGFALGRLCDTGVAARLGP